MSTFLHMKHWQVAGICFGLPLLLFMVKLEILRMDIYDWPDPTPFGAIIGGLAGIYWFYVVGTQLNRRIPETTRLRLFPFRASLFLLLFGLVSAFGPMSLLPVYPGALDMMDFSWHYLLSTPICALIGVSWFYASYFVSKGLRTVETGQPVRFMEYFADFVSVVYIGVGIWLVQPRINRIFRA